MKITMDDKGNLYIDGEKKEIKDLNAKLLEKIVDELLQDNCEIYISGDNPLANFIHSLEEKTSNESDLRKEIIKEKEMQEKCKEKLKSLDSSYENEGNENN